MKNKSKQHSLKAKLHTSLLDSCFILDSLWNADPERYTTPNIHLIPGTLVGAHGTDESSAPTNIIYTAQQKFSTDFIIVSSFL